VGSGSVVKMAVSSAKVLRIVLSDWGRSAVYNGYRNGPSMLPWGTPESIGSKDDVLSGPVISPTQRPLPDNTQHSQETEIHAPGGIRTRNTRKRRPQIQALDRADTGIGLV
jgi:hypothetical protein